MLQMFQGLKIGMAILNRLKSDSDRKELVTTFVSILGDGKKHVWASEIPVMEKLRNNF